MLQRNLLLAGLPEHELDVLRRHGRVVTLESGTVLYRRGEPITQIYLMTSGLTSLLAETGDDQLGEVGLIGRDGLVGLPAVLLSDAAMPWVTLVQAAGEALRLPAGGLRRLLEQTPAFGERCYRYVETLMFQVSQTAACNARHGLSQRLARWLLLALDRMEGNTIPFTHDFLANMLGVRRAGVTVTASGMQAAGLLQVARKRITVTDRAGLERACCSCYRHVHEHEREARSRNAVDRGEVTDQDAIRAVMAGPAR